MKRTHKPLKHIENSPMREIHSSKIYVKNQKAHEKWCNQATKTIGKTRANQI